MATIEGKVGPVEGRFAIVVAKFNDTITGRLLDGAKQMLAEHGVGEDRVDVAWVPGAFEIPLVADRLASTGKYVAVICLGCVIRGETTHDQHINRAVSNSLMEAGLRHSMPIIFGVLTCNTLEQAIARSGGEVGTRGKDREDSKIGNKGAEAAEAALDMVDLMARLPGFGGDCCCCCDKQNTAYHAVKFQPPSLFGVYRCSQSPNKLGG